MWVEKFKFLGGSENRKTSYQWEHEVGCIAGYCGETIWSVSVTMGNLEHGVG